MIVGLDNGNKIKRHVSQVKVLVDFNYINLHFSPHCFYHFSYIIPLLSRSYFIVVPCSFSHVYVIKIKLRRSY
jgi:hypothetical protein